MVAVGILVVYVSVLYEPSVDPGAAIVATLDVSESQHLQSDVGSDPDTDSRSRTGADESAPDEDSGDLTVSVSQEEEQLEPQTAEQTDADPFTKYTWTTREQKFRNADELIRTESEDIEWAGQAKEHVESIVAKAFGKTDPTLIVVECLETICYLDLNISREDYSEKMIEFRREWAASGRHMFSDLRIDRRDDELFRFYFFR